MWRTPHAALNGRLLLDAVWHATHALVLQLLGGGGEVSVFGVVHAPRSFVAGAGDPPPAEDVVKRCGVGTLLWRRTGIGRSRPRQVDTPDLHEGCTSRGSRRWRSRCTFLWRHLFETRCTDRRTHRPGSPARPDRVAALKVETSDRQAVRRDRLAPSHSITARSSGSLYRTVPAPSVATNYGSWWPVSTSLPSGSSAAQVHIVGVGELPRVNGIGPHLIPLGGVGTISSSRMDLLEHLDRRFGPIGPNGF
jgi:hypothetical protein